MATQVSFQNPATGEIKTVKVGFSWTLFFFGFIFGLPCFIRGLTTWGVIMAAVSVLYYATIATPIVFFLMVPMLALDIYLGVKGNELTAKSYLAKGWQFAEPDAITTKQGRQKWGLLLAAQQSAQPQQPQAPQGTAPGATQ